MAASYAATLEWLDGLEMAKGMRLGLDRLYPVLERLGQPQRAFEVAHIAGTNGKGSSAAMLESVCRQAGLRTGLYTSPHLRSFTERIRVGGQAIDESSVTDGVERIRQAMTQAGVELTYFELATVLAFVEFARVGVDMALVEVGLGGRLDATNVVDARLGFITSIGLDHAEQLGATLREVAREKAGIIKPAMTVLAGRLPGPALAELDRAASRVGGSVRALGRDFEIAERARSVSLAGPHQTDNAALVCEAARLGCLGPAVDDTSLVRGLASVRWPARLETVAEHPRVILDSAHNPDGAAALSRALDGIDLVGPRVLVFGAMADKDWPSMLDHLLPGFDETVLVRPAQPRAASPERIKDGLARRPSGAPGALALFDAASEGLDYAARRAGSEGTVVVAGSVFLSAELYEMASGRSDPFSA